MSSESVTVQQSIFPFPKDISRLVENNEKSALGAHVLRALGQILRSNRQVWDECVRHLKRPAETFIGSMATELIVFIDLNGMPHVMTRSDDKAAVQRSAVYQDITTVLCKRGLNAKYTSAMALDIVRETSVKNAEVIATFKTLMLHSDEHVLAFRIALKPIAQVTPLPGNQCVMFADSHANCGILDTVRKAVVIVEPNEGLSNVPMLHTLIASVFQHRLYGYAFYCNLKSEIVSPSLGVSASGDRLCTLLSAVFALVCLAFGIASQSDFEYYLVYMRANRAELLRYFLAMLTRVVKSLRIPLPVL